MNHIDDETAVDWLEDRLPEESKSDWKEHLEACAKCSQALSEWKEILDNLTAPDLTSAPEQAITKATEVFPTESKLLNIKRTIATTIFDSFSRPPAFAGVRGATDARQMLLRTENIDIDLHVTQSNLRTFVWGQLLPRHDNTMVGRVQVTLLCDGERVQSARTNEEGEFRFEDVPDGELSIGVYIPSMSRQVFGVFKIQRN